MRWVFFNYSVIFWVLHTLHDPLHRNCPRPSLVDQYIITIFLLFFLFLFFWSFVLKKDAVV